ncbi:MAG: MarR family winged helix-turn-helix transcriptional regulator [Chitinophagaceae bacterium]
MKTTDSKYCKCLYFTTNALARKVEKLALESWKPVDLSPSHAYLLILVIEQPSIQPGALANHLQLSPSTITRLIEKLEEKQLVSRITEGKITNVYPTETAIKMTHSLQKCIQHFNQQYAHILGKEEMKNMITSMGTLADKLAT